MKPQNSWVIRCPRQAQYRDQMYVLEGSSSTVAIARPSPLIACQLCGHSPAPGEYSVALFANASTPLPALRTPLYVRLYCTWGRYVLLTFRTRTLRRRREVSFNSVRSAPHLFVTLDIVSQSRQRNHPACAGVTSTAWAARDTERRPVQPHNKPIPSVIPQQILCEKAILLKYSHSDRCYNSYKQNTQIHL